MDSAPTAERIAEVKFAFAMLELEAEESFVVELATRLDSIRNVNIGCLKVGGNGVIIWIKSRLIELGGLPIGMEMANADRVTCIFHFWPWDTDKYGPHPTNDDRAKIEELEAGVQRSPLMRLVDSKPVDRVCYRVAGERK